jgi:hypothetical protein
MKQDRLWVDPLFKKKIKAEAAKQGKSVLELTQDMSKDSEEIEQIVKKKFSFKF